jgi:hypothetical protein
MKPGAWIDVDRAKLLKKTGLTWRQVAAQLSDEAGRVPPFQTDSITRAIYLDRKKHGVLT